MYHTLLYTFHRFRIFTRSPKTPSVRSIQLNNYFSGCYGDSKIIHPLSLYVFILVDLTVFRIWDKGWTTITVVEGSSSKYRRVGSLDKTTPDACLFLPPRVRGNPCNHAELPIYASHLWKIISSLLPTHIYCTYTRKFLYFPISSAISFSYRERNLKSNADPSPNCILWRVVFLILLYFCKQIYVVFATCFRVFMWNIFNGIRAKPIFNWKVCESLKSKNNKQRRSRVLCCSPMTI